jgi:hypothetical protein
MVHVVTIENDNKSDGQKIIIKKPQQSIAYNNEFLTFGKPKKTKPDK